MRSSAPCTWETTRPQSMRHCRCLPQHHAVAATFLIRSIRLQQCSVVFIPCSVTWSPGMLEITLVSNPAVRTSSRLEPCMSLYPLQMPPCVLTSCPRMATPCRRSASRTPSSWRHSRARAATCGCAPARPTWRGCLGRTCPSSPPSVTATLPVRTAPRPPAYTRTSPVLAEHGALEVAHHRAVL